VNNYPLCKICGHLVQNHQDKYCMHCALVVHYPKINVREQMTGYCGKDNLKYLEYLVKKVRLRNDMD